MAPSGALERTALAVAHSVAHLTPLCRLLPVQRQVLRVDTISPGAPLRAGAAHSCRPWDTDTADAPRGRRLALSRTLPPASSRLSQIVRGSGHQRLSTRETCHIRSQVKELMKRDRR